MIILLRRLSTRENSIFFLTLVALICLPIALKEVVSDASLSLLLPVTILGVLTAFVLASTGIKKTWAVFILFIFGPLIIFLRISEVGGALLATIRESLIIVSNIIVSAEGSTNTSLDLSPWFIAGNLFLSQANGFVYRLFVWLESIAHNVPIWDLAARAFVWSLSLWLIAAWASWQIRRNGNTLAGFTPVTIMLGLILYNTAPRSGVIWLYVSALIFMLGITNIENLVIPWKRQGIDFADSIWEDSFFATLVLVIGLVITSYMVSSFSIKEMMDRIRERPMASSTTLEKTGSAVGTNTRGESSLPASHAILGGPSLSQDVVMLISTGDFPPMPHAVNLEVPYYHWRALTYQDYTGSGWNNPTGTIDEIQSHRTLIQSTPATYRIVHQAVTFPAGSIPALYWTGTLVQADTRLQVTWRSAPVIDPASAGFDPLLGEDMVGGLISEIPAGAGVTYTAESILPDVSDSKLRSAPASYPAWVSQRYLALPATVPERVRALARDLTANAPTPYDQAVAIEIYLRKFPYSLNVPAPPINQDAADYFLFDLKKGYCDYYATAMTVLARAAGLPARLVIGYASGTYDPYNAQYVIRKADAHAWSEIYFTGIGWIEFEPTASQPAIPRAGNSTPLPRPSNASQSQGIWDQAATLITDRINGLWKPLFTIVFLYLLWSGTEGLRLSLLSPSEAIQRLFQRLRNLSRSMIGDPPIYETASEYASVLNGQLASIQSRNRLSNWLLLPVHSQINFLTGLYIQSLFSRIPLTRTDIRCAIQSWNNLRWRLFIINILQTLQVGLTGH